VNQLCSKVDLLINNAGVFFHPPKETVDKFDVTFQTNYLGRFDAMYVGELNYLLIIVIFLQGIFF
jgi:NAD(P)-dependent dehydrogenase (short-subunit alcohol dehydrogenase family)